MYFCLKENLNSFRSGWHISPFGNANAAISNKLFCLIAVQLVLGGTRQCNITFHFPWLAAVYIFGIRILAYIFAYSAILLILKVHYKSKLLFINPVGIINVAGRIRKSNHFPS